MPASHGAAARSLGLRRSGDLRSEFLDNLAALPLKDETKDPEEFAATRGLNLHRPDHIGRPLPARSSRWLDGAARKCLAEHHTINSQTGIIRDDWHSLRIWHPLKMETIGLMKPNRPRLFRRRDGFELCAAARDGESSEVVIKLPGEAELAVETTNRDEVNVANGLRLRDGLHDEKEPPGGPGSSMTS